MLTPETLTRVPLSVDTVNMARAASSRAVSTSAYHHGNLRESLVDAALKLARTGGPEAVVLRAVSRQAGVSHSAAYRHFTDHEELLAAVSARCMDELSTLMIQRTSQVAARAKVKRAWDKLEAIGRAYIDFAVAEPGWFRTAFAGTGHSPPPPDHHSERARILNPFQLLAARLDELVEVAAIPPERRPRAEYAAWSMVHGLSSLLVNGPLRVVPAAEVDRAITSVLAVVQRGL